MHAPSKTEMSSKKARLLPGLAAPPHNSVFSRRLETPLGNVTVFEYHRHSVVSAGTPVTAVHPQLTGHPVLDDSVFGRTDPEVLGDADLLFTALPHGESAELAARLPAELKIIDLGPEGGEEGGRVVAQGTPEQVARVKKSYTGQALAGFFSGNGKRSE